MNNRMERFNQRARRALSLAKEEADRLKHSVVGTEHLLIGLMRVEGGVAERVMKAVGLELPKVKALVEHLTSDYTRTPGAQTDLTDELKAVLEMAVEQARKLSHPYIGTEHLLLALAQHPDGQAREVFKRLNIAPDEITRQTHNLLQELPPPTEELSSKESVTETSLTKLLKLSTPVRRVMLYAADEARRAKAESIETEHLLLALMREHEQFISTATLFFKITPDELRRMLQEHAAKKQSSGE
jgi:ATP-dependent Clp protease ATP-binding subunit ClpA